MSEKDKKLDQIIKTIDANDIKFLKLQFSDIHGLPKSMAVPLKKADDAVEVDCSNMSIEEVTDRIIELFEQVKG